MAVSSEQAQRFREFRMPDVGEGLTEAEILKWFVGVGDTVADGQVVCEVETAKAAVELPIPFDGVVREIRFAEGTTVDVGTPIIVVDAGEQAGGAAAPAAAGPAVVPDAVPAVPAVEAAPAEEKPAARTAVLVGYGVAPSTTTRRPRKPQVPAPAAPVQPATEVPPVQAPVEPAAPQAPAQPAAPEDGRDGASPMVYSRPLAKPPVRKLAKELGIDLATVAPTGPNGVVTREDIRAAAAPPAQLPPVLEPAPQGREREVRVPVKGVRKATAQAMVASAFTAPHVTEFVTFDITRTMKLVQELRADPAFAGVKVSPLLLVAKALLVAIRRNPEINAAWDEANQEIVHKSYVNLGIAAATPRGLIVPNIKDAQDKTLPELAAALGELVGTAREGRTAPNAMQGGTVTITNVGVFGIDTGTPILNRGESAILAFGAVKLQPWVHKGKVKPRQVTTLALSFDHRLVDGELGSKVLGDVAAILEQPKRLLTWA
ncbi:dihydrolipoamide acetyltransferase family protein [Actinacidiphila yeochonensis]|uniref:dihydrolipoamide acetyltransferase family protein n=1 Tax=Actinacidiphila yeochonensis TaxID=89050 RepID=UPI000569141C|nr:dihydrolipoamide acetyltransferase family protein [Actinacidiphila yeochonensis]